ncbi:hypothetical protein LSH36_11g05033 [Paralvinella palmiformis]|uniref:Hexosyltransferase n=1 Tax=Paralvinella palmiformis TaxID=53620 RepID=A0AAD9KEK1_9ANNE|nr:hypothetical protein LSH36_11g05033 [Paralvinella palmiformis]
MTSPKVCVRRLCYHWRSILLAVSCTILIVVLVHVSRYVLYSTPVPVYVLDKLNLRQYTLPELACQRCNNFSYDYIVENEKFCGDEEIFLLTFVTSFHTNVASRNTMRKTWAATREYRGLKLKTVFVFGTHPDRNLNNQTQYEQARYGDIIQANFADHYRFLTNKTSLALRWVMKNCRQAKYVLKTDDDSFNILENFVDYLIHVKTERFVGGYCFTVMPDRRSGSKFHVSADSYPDLYYPTYCAGPGYVLSRAAVRDIVAVTENTRFIPMEDVFITGMCRIRAGIQYTEIPGMVVGQDQMTPCNLAIWVKNGHNIVPGRAEMIWKRLQSVDRTKDCASRTTYLYMILIGFVLIWSRFMYRMYSVPTR